MEGRKRSAHHTVPAQVTQQVTQGTWTKPTFCIHRGHKRKTIPVITVQGHMSFSFLPGPISMKCVIRALLCISPSPLWPSVSPSILPCPLLDMDFVPCDIFLCPCGMLVILHPTLLDFPVSSVLQAVSPVRLDPSVSLSLRTLNISLCPPPEAWPWSLAVTSDLSLDVQLVLKVLVGESVPGPWLVPPHVTV